MLVSHPLFPANIGRYEITRVLGQGAMGRVLLAHDPVLRRDVAVKVLRDDLNISQHVHDSLVNRMRHEAQAAARVSHPNLVTLHDMGHDPSVGLYLVFEYVNGPNLKERLSSGRLPPHQAARLARELGGALATAHLAGVLHRDVKPENVMLSPAGAKLADFGIAKIPDSTLTRTGTLVGTPAYCAPEALSSGLFSPESDQFSLAATLYEAISGERAFPGDDAVGVAAKIATEDPRLIARKYGLSDDIDAVLLRALAKDPALRFTSAAEFGECLATALEQTFQATSTANAATLLAPPGVVGHRPVMYSQAAYANQEDGRPLRLALGTGLVGIVGVLLGLAAARGIPFFFHPVVAPSSASAAAASVEPPLSPGRPGSAPSAPATHSGPGAPPRPRAAAATSAAASSSAPPRGSANPARRDDAPGPRASAGPAASSEAN